MGSSEVLVFVLVRCAVTESGGSTAVTGGAVPSRVSGWSPVPRRRASGIVRVMSVFPESGRQVAHVLLDAVAAYDPNGAEIPAGMSSPTELAYQRISAIPGAVDVDVWEAGDDTNVTVDLSNVLGASLILLNQAASVIAEQRGVAREVVIAELREYVDL